MYPTFKHMILAHPLPLFLFWLPSLVWLASRINPNWDSLDPEHKLAVIAAFALWGIPTLFALPKVWWHLYQKRKHTDPEERRRNRRIRLKLLFILFISGGLMLALRFLSEQTYSAYPDPSSYALAAGGLIALLVVLKIVSRLYSRFRFRSSEKPFVVRWCLPVPKRAPVAAEIHAALPDYCRQLLATGSQKPKAAA